MGMAAIGVALWKYVMQYSPENPKYFNRDRFVLSNGGLQEKFPVHLGKLLIPHQGTAVCGNTPLCTWLATGI